MSPTDFVVLNNWFGGPCHYRSSSLEDPEVTASQSFTQNVSFIRTKTQGSLDRHAHTQRRPQPRQMRHRNLDKVSLYRILGHLFLLTKKES